MPTAEYLRSQAENCLRIARAGFDLATAERLRHMAADLRAKADELERQGNGTNNRLNENRFSGPTTINGSLVAR